MSNFQNIKLKQQPGDFVMRTQPPHIIMQVHDVSDLTDKQTLQMKQKHAIHCTTEVNNRYFLLTFQGVLQTEMLDNLTEEETRQKLADLMLEAGDYVHNEILKYNN